MNKDVAHFTLHTFTSHYTLTLNTVHFTLHTDTIHWSLNNAHYTDFTMHTAPCTLHTVPTSPEVLHISQYTSLHVWYSCIASRAVGHPPALHWTALNCTALHCINALHCVNTLHCTTLLCNSLHCTELYCNALQYITKLHYFVLQYTELDKMNILVTSSKKL